MSKDNRSARYIARKLGIGRDTVGKILARYNATGSPGSGSRSGRPRATTEEEDTQIAVSSYLQPFSPPRELRRALDLSVSPRTVDRRLQAAGLFGRVARKKRDYSQTELTKRLSFALQGYAHWTAEDWAKVLFSDEKIFWGKGKNGQTWVRRPVGEALNPLYTVHKQAHPVKVNVWACFSAAVKESCAKHA